MKRPPDARIALLVPSSTTSIRRLQGDGFDRGRGATPAEGGQDPPHRGGGTVCPNFTVEELARARRVGTPSCSQFKNRYNIVDRTLGGM